MQVALAALADSANTTEQGKMNLLGVFDSIRGREFPLVHPAMALALRFRAEHSDQQQTHEVRVVLLDMDGNELFEADGEIEIGRIEPGHFQHTNLVINVRGARFEQPGRYRFRIELGEEEEPHDTVFQVRRAG